MGKKLQANTKAVEARGRKAEAKAAASEGAKKQEEEEYWSKFNEPRGRKDAKKEEAAAKQAEQAAKRAELKRLQAEEEAELTAAAKKKTPNATKMTAHQLAVMKEAQQKQMERDAAAHATQAQRVVTEDEYAQTVEVANANKEAVAVDARSLDAALEQLTVAGDSPADRHPEKRAKAMWETFYAEQLPIMKAEKPGLKQMQYKNRIFEQWMRSPLNPRNQQPKQ